MSDRPNNAGIRKALDALRGIVDDLSGVDAVDTGFLVEKAKERIHDLRVEAGLKSYIHEKLDSLEAHFDGLDGKGGFQGHPRDRNIVWCLQALGALEMHHGFGHLLDKQGHDF